MYIGPTIVIIVGVVLMIALIFVGFQWVKPQSLKLKVKWNCLEFELQRQQQVDTRKIPAKRRQ